MHLHLLYRHVYSSAEDVDTANEPDEMEVDPDMKETPLEASAADNTYST